MNHTCLTRLAASLIIALAVIALASPASHGDDPLVMPGSPPLRSDADIAREAVGRGEFMSLEQILVIISRDHPGQILGIELEHDDGFWEYEVEIVTPQGRLIEIKLDPANGRILDYGDDDD